MGFIEECKKLDRHIKKLYGPKAGIKWQQENLKALKYVTPLDLKQMSIIDVFELVGVREAMETKAKPAKGNHKWTAEEEAEARAKYNEVNSLYDRGVSIKSACQRVGISNQTYYNYDKRFKVV